MKEGKFKIGKAELKEKHYKKGRFSEKEKLEADFKKKNITNDMKKSEIRASEFIDINMQILKKGDAILIPKENEITSIRTQSQMNIFSIFLQFIKNYGAIDYLSIQTYTFNEKTVYALKELLDSGKIKKLQIIMTETANFRIPKIYRLLKDLFSERKECNLCFYWVHSKVNLIKCGNDKYVLDGSGNFSMNAQVEQYNIINSKKLFDADKEWQDGFFFGNKLRKNHEIFKNF